MAHPARGIPRKIITPRELPEAAARRAALLEERRRIDALVHATPGGEHRAFGLATRASAALLKQVLHASGQYRRGRRNALNLHLRREEWTHPDLPPALDGLRILHLTDLHYGVEDFEFARAVENLLGGIETDLCLITGDYRFGHVGPVSHVRDRLSALLPKISVRHGIFATLGNHDTLDILDGLEHTGLVLLVNEGREVRINGSPVWIAGTDDSHSYQCADIEAACDGAGEEHFIIAMVHTPEIVEEAAARGVHLYLCGHTHGGQVRLPGVGALVTASRCARRHVLGRWRHGRMLGLTSAGLGTTTVPVRFNCPPECHLITLRRSG